MFGTKREKDFREEEEQRLFFQTTSKRLERHTSTLDRYRKEISTFVRDKKKNKTG